MRISFLGVSKALAATQTFPLAFKGPKGDRGDRGDRGQAASFVVFTDETAYNSYVPQLNETAVLNG